MNRCPICQTIYEDQTLFFCLEDGTKLIPNQSSKYIIPTVVVTKKTPDPPTTLVYQSAEVKSNLSFYIRLAAIGVLVFIAAFAGFIFIALQMTPSTNINYAIPNKTTKTEEAKPPANNESPKAVTKTDQCEIESKKYDIEDTVNTLEFQMGSSKLIEESRDNLSGEAENIKLLPDKCNLEITVRSYGIRSQSSEKNFAQAQLNKSRAEEIKYWLVKYGVKADRIKSGGQVDYQTTSTNSTPDEYKDYHIELKIQSSEATQNEPRCSSTVANC